MKTQETLWGVTPKINLPMVALAPKKNRAQNLTNQEENPEVNPNIKPNKNRARRVASEVRIRPFLVGFKDHLEGL